jgi:hypothetical protein
MKIYTVSRREKYMKVYYSGNFWGGHKYEHAGHEIPINKTFQWGGLQWRIPAAYLCAKGLVLVFCVAIPRDRIENYYRCWNPDRRRSVLSGEDHIQLQRDNPFSIDLDVEVRVNGNKLERSRMCAVSWHPLEEERDHDEKVQEEFLEHYACDRSQGWRFIRVSIPWSTSRKPKVRSLSLRLDQAPVMYPGTHFVTEGSSEQQEVKVLHPVTGMEHKLIITECKCQKLPDDAFKFGEDMEFPNHYMVLTYRITPELSMREISIADCAKGDPPKSKIMNSLSSKGNSACSVGIIGGACGISAVFIPGKEAWEYNWRTASSSLHYEAVPRVEWRIIFFVKETENIEVEIEV